MLDPIQAIVDAIDVALQQTASHDTPNIQVQLANQPELGQFQSNIALLLTKHWQKNPIEIAESLQTQLINQPIFERVIVSKPGFINFTLTADFFNEALNALSLDPRLGVPLSQKPQNVVIDYSSPNIAKNMHIGHLRSTIIGDAIVRLLTFCGDYVIRQNHIGDWGTQFGMLIEHLTEHNIDPEQTDLNQTYQTAKKRFDDEPDFAIAAKKRVVSLQRHEPDTLSIWKKLVNISQNHFSLIYRKLGILLDEADVRAESFYNDRLEPLIQTLQKNNICQEDQGAKVIFLDRFKDRDNKPFPLLVQKSDNGFLYATTDLAALEFRINELEANRIVYVVDARQEQHFSMVFDATRLIGWGQSQVQLESVLFGMVLGKDGKPFKTREGTTVPLESLIDESINQATKLVKSRHPEWSHDQIAPIAEAIAIGSLKYADLANDKIKNYVFDFDRMLALDGNTAPYLQNAYVRIQSILRKSALTKTEAQTGNIQIHTEVETKLACHITLFPREIISIRDSLSLHRLCHYLYRLASLYHQFYEQNPILSAPPATKESRLALSLLTANILAQGLSILGIKTIEHM